MQRNENSESNIERMKSSNDDSPTSLIQRDEIELALAALPLDHEQLLKILQPDMDCQVEFDKMSLSELICLGKKCERRQQVIGWWCLQQNYPQVVAYVKDETIRIGYNFKADHFIEFISKITIDDDDDFRFFSRIQSKFNRLREIELWCVYITAAKIERIKGILSELECLRLYACAIHGDLHEIVLAFCPKLSHLDVYTNYTQHDWLHQKYPTLKYFKFCPHQADFTELVTTFLDTNPNIRKFATSSKFLWCIRSSLTAANIALDDLAIKIEDAILYEEEIRLLCHLLNELHSSGFYKKLHLYYCCEYKRTFIDQLALLTGLVKLYVSQPEEQIELSALKNLEELFIISSDQIMDFKALATNLTNLKMIHLNYACLDEIVPFISQAVKMEEIVIEFLRDEIKKNENIIIDLFALNTGREKLDGAQKVTLYVRENIYLETKRAAKQTDFRLINLKRIESYRWSHDF